MRNPLDMIVFATVVELQSFSAAASRLGMSRSAASKHVTRLESALGVRLLSRTTRKLSLTEPGRSALEHCRRLAAEVDAGERAVQPFLSHPTGRLRVSAPGAFGRLHVAPTLPDYLARHPDVSVDLVLNDRLVDLVQEGFDIAISSTPLMHANLVGREIAPMRWSLCAAPAYLKRHGAPDEPTALTRHNCIFYSSLVTAGNVWSFSRSGEVTTVSVNGNFRANNSEAVRDSAVRGLGVAMLPTFAIWQSIGAGTLVRIMPDWAPMGTFGTALTAYFIADKHLAPKIRTLVDFMVGRFGAHPYWDRGFDAPVPSAATHARRA